MHSKMDLNLFPVLMAIYREGSITQAAKRLFITQPAVSHALSRLRDMFEDPLFQRHGRRMVPTALCHQIMPSVTSAVEQLHFSLQTADVFDLSAQRRHIRLGLRDIMESLFCPSLIAKSIEFAPGVTLQSQHVVLSDIASLLKKGELDIAIDALMPVPADIKHIHVRDESFVLLHRSNHPLGHQLNLESYADAHHALVTVKHAKVNQVDMALARLGKQRHIAFTCEHYLAAAQVACQTDMLLTLPRAYAATITALLPMVVRPLPFEIDPLPLHMYWHHSVTDDPLHKQIRKWLTEAVGEVG